MAYPTRPALTLVPATTTSFTAAIGTDPGTTVRLYYRSLTASGSDTLGGSITGSGSLTVSGLVDSASYLVFAVADNLTDGYSLPAIGFVSLALNADTVPAAMVAKFNANPTLSALVSGGLWLGEVPETVNLPYGYVDLRRVNYVHYTEASLELTDVDVSIYCIGAKQAELVAQSFKDAFDWCLSMPFAKRHFVQCMPVDYQIVSENVRYRDMELVYRVTLGYEVMTQKDQPTNPI